jgi:hypothetical protein
VKINISEKQRLVIIAALDAYSRLQMGQLWAVAEVVQGCKDKHGKPLPDYWDIRHEHTDALTRALFDYPGNASHGICSQHVPDTAKIAYDLQCVLAGVERQHQICKSEPLAEVAT